MNLKSIAWDLETYSSVDLAKCGVYRYCESEDFEILLAAYSVDGGAVRVVDLACGEKLPEEILDALEGRISLAYDGNGNLLAQTDQNGHTSEYRYDAVGPLSAQTRKGT